MHSSRTTTHDRKHKQVNHVKLKSATEVGSVRSRPRNQMERKWLTQLAAIVQSSDDAIIGKTLDGVITYWNKGAERIYGYSAVEACGKPVSILIPSTRSNELTEILARIRNGERVESYETERTRKDGTGITMSLTVSPIKGPDGKLVGASTIARDITERKRMEEELKAYSEHLEELIQKRTADLTASEKKSRLLIDNMADAVFTIDLEGNYTFCTPQAEKLTGYSVQQLVSMNIKQLIAPEDLTAILKRLEARARGEKELAPIQFEIIRADGTRRHVEIHTALLLEGGKPVGIQGIARDNTERKRLEGEIKEMNQQLTVWLMKKTDQMDNIYRVREELRKVASISAGLDLVLDAVMEDLKVDVGAVLTVDQDRTALEPRGIKSRTEAVELKEQYPLNAKLLELEPLNTGQSLSKIVQANERTILGTASVHSSPIHFGRELYGVLVTGSQNAEELEESDLMVLSEYAGLVSQLFEIQNLTVTPVKEIRANAVKRFELTPGVSYLVKNDPTKAFEVFVDSVRSGMEGLCITRRLPDSVRKRCSLEKTPIIWLSTERLQGETSIHSLQDLSLLIGDFLEKAENGIILLDGLEYLITNHGFDAFIRFLQIIRNRCEAKGSVFMAPILEKALDAKENTLIETEMQSLLLEQRVITLTQRTS
jgi:PAS domain S-box-containing protein